MISAFTVSPTDQEQNRQLVSPKLKMVSCQDRKVKWGQDRGVLQVVVVPATNGRTATWTARSTKAGTQHCVSEGQQVCVVVLVWAAALLVGSASTMASAAGKP